MIACLLAAVREWLRSRRGIDQRMWAPALEERRRKEWRNAD